MALAARRVPWIARGALFAGALALGALAFAMQRPDNIDDAYIALVYARHLASGGGFYWNAGEGHVDGFTSVLDVVVKAAALRVFHADPLLTAWVLTVLFFAGAVALGAALAMRGARGDRASTLAAALGALAFASNVALAQGASYVLETTLYALVMLAAVRALVTRGATRAPALALFALEWALVSLARPEGAALALLFAAYFAVTRRRRAGLARALAPGALWACAMGAYLAWHRAYFGFVAPNTFYAKASDSRVNELHDGLAYVRAFAEHTPGGALAVLALAACPLFASRAFAWRRARARRELLLVSGAALIGAATVVAGGGDGYPGGRFLAVPIALVVVALAMAGAGLASARAAALALIPLGLIFAGGARVALRDPALAARAARADFPLAARNSRRDVEIAATLRRAGITSYAQTDYQRLKLFADDLRVVDLTGLNDAAVAHAPWPGQDLWGKAVFEDAPRTGVDAFEIGLTHLEPPALGFGALTTDDLFDHPEAARVFIGRPLDPRARAAFERYVPVSFPPLDDGLSLGVFVRADLAQRLRGPGFRVGGAPVL